MNDAEMARDFYHQGVKRRRERTGPIEVQEELAELEAFAARVRADQKEKDAGVCESLKAWADTYECAAAIRGRG